MAEKDNMIEGIDASFEEVVNAIIPKANAGPKPNPMIGSVMKASVSLATAKDLIWTKKLSKTDAQRETAGGLVPYLRLTRSKMPLSIDYQTWFRNTFFAGQNWQPGTFGREVGIEKCKVTFDVTFQGVALGSIPFEVTHGPHRWESNNTPNTWVHWPQKVQDYLLLNDLSGLPVKLTRHGSGHFSMRLGS